MGYRALDKTDRNVTLTTGSTPLLGLRVLSPADTVSLARTPFALARTAGPSGSEVLTYTGTAAGRPITIKYTVVPDSFVMHVTGSVGANPAGTPASFLLIDLPQTFRSYEADSLDDHNHLAFAIKPVRQAGLPRQCG